MFKRVIWFAAGATAGVVAARKAEKAGAGSHGAVRAAGDREQHR